MRLLRFGTNGPEREPGVAGEYVRLRDVALRQPDPIADTVADLVRRYDPGGYVLDCPVAGCGWQLLVPRMELDPTVLDVDPGGAGFTVYAEGVPREDVERELAGHVDWHACSTETGVLW